MKTTLYASLFVLAVVLTGCKHCPLLGRQDKSPSGLIAYWAADGNASDSVGSHHGTLKGSVSYSAGRKGQAFDFQDGSRVAIPDDDAFMTSSFSLTGWVYPRANYGMVVFRGDNRPGLDTFTVSLYTPGKLTFAIGDANGQAAILEAPINLMEWTHFAATFDQGSGKMMLYCNGKLENETKTDLRPILALESGGLGIGNHGGFFHQFGMNGKVDEVGIYSRALSAREVASLASGRK